MSDIIQQYFDLQQKVHDYFGYREDWVVIPMEPHLGEHWMICGPEDDNSTSVVWSEEPFTKKTITQGKVIYNGTIYTQRFLPKWVYRGEKYTMIAVDTHCDGNKILMIFENALECKDEKMKQIHNERW